ALYLNHREYFLRLWRRNRDRLIHDASSRTCTNTLTHASCTASARGSVIGTSSVNQRPSIKNVQHMLPERNSGLSVMVALTNRKSLCRSSPQGKSRHKSWWSYW